jgi:hypothetical protein
MVQYIELPLGLKVLKKICKVDIDWWNFIASIQGNIGKAMSGDLSTLSMPSPINSRSM